MTQKITVKKCMTLYVTSCMTQNMGAIFFLKRVYDTKVYDTKCTTQKVVKLHYLIKTDVAQKKADVAERI